MAIRRSHRLFDRARRSRGRRLRFSRWGPTILWAEASTRSQLLTKAVLAEIGVVDLPAFAGVPALVLIAEDEQGEQALLVDPGAEQGEHPGVREGAVLSGDSADRRHPDPDEAVPLGVLARAGLEEALRVRGDLVVGQGLQVAAGLCCRRS